MILKNVALRISACAVVLALSTLGAPTAFAHGAAKPLHGGIVQSASDLSFELVPSRDGAVIHVLDHEDEFDTAGTSGNLTVLNGREKAVAELKPAGGNKLEAKGVKLGKGSKVVAVLQTADKKTITLRFTLK